MSWRFPRSPLWTTNYPASLVESCPDMPGDPGEGADDQVSDIRPSMIHLLRDKLAAVAAYVGSAALETGSLLARMAGVEASKVSQTTAELHVYADGTNGNDAWDGTAAANVPGTLIGPKKTRKAAAALIPDYIRHNTCLHLAGVFGAAAETVNFRVQRQVDPGITLLIDGGSDRTVVADNGGSPWAADIASTSTIGLTTAGWTVDAYMGYWVRVSSGPAAGQVRLIQSNTATTLTTNSVFTVSPGAGATFDIIRPSTEFQAAAFNARFWGGGTVFIQNFYVTGSTTGTSLACIPGSQCNVWLSNYITATSMASAINVYAGELSTTKSNLNPATFVDVGTSGQQCGVSQIGTSADGIVYQHCNYANANNVVAKKVALKQTYSLYMSYCRILAMSMYGSRTYNSAANIAATTKLEALTMFDSSVRIAAADVSNSATHGITLSGNSFLHLDGAVTGTGNGGAGVYAHSGSIVHIKNAAPPTLTGSVGDLSFDGSTQASTWAAIDAGTPAVEADELSMCKEVA